MRSSTAREVGQDAGALVAARAGVPEQTLAFSLVRHSPRSGRWAQRVASDSSSSARGSAYVPVGVRRLKAGPQVGSATAPPYGEGEIGTLQFRSPRVR